jgi:hypothetical protein
MAQHAILDAATWIPNHFSIACRVHVPADGCPCYASRLMSTTWLPRSLQNISSTA